MIDGYVHTIHVHPVNVNTQEDHSDLVREFFALTEGTQERRAGLMDVDRSTVSRWKTALKKGRRIHLDDVNADRMTSVVERLRGRDPHAEAYRKGVRDARSVIEDAVRRLKELDATGSTEEKGDPTKAAKKRFPKGEDPRQDRKRGGDG